MITSCYAYQILEFEDYRHTITAPLTQESFQLQEKIDARLPVESKATQEKVAKHHVDLANFSYSLFILGGDDFSYQWLKEHAKEFEEKNMLGFITNISDPKRLQAFQKLTKMPLMPANIDDLLEVLHENHYPLALHEGQIWQ